MNKNGSGNDDPRPLGYGKPALRGVSHVVASFVALFAGWCLAIKAPTKEGRQASIIFTTSLCVLFTVSGLYHVINWQPGTRKWWRRADHAAIFVQIAGTYTPICLLALGKDLGPRLLTIIWTCASLGILQSLLFVNLPKTLAACLYIAFGWVGVHYRQEIVAMTGWHFCLLILGGGLLYTIGAAVYALKRPSPFPKTFGYHEIFHLFVILAASVHFVAVATLVLHPTVKHS